MLWAKAWTRWPLEVPCNLNYYMSHESIIAGASCASLCHSTLQQLQNFLCHFMMSRPWITRRPLLKKLRWLPAKQKLKRLLWQFSLHTLKPSEQTRAGNDEDWIDSTSCTREELCGSCCPFTCPFKWRASGLHPFLVNSCSVLDISRSSSSQKRNI